MTRPDKNNPFEIKNPLFQDGTDNEAETEFLEENSMETLPTDENAYQPEVSEDISVQNQAELPSSEVANPLYLGEETDETKKKKAVPQNPPKKPAEDYTPSPDEWLDIEGRRLKIPRNLRHSIFSYESGKRQTKKSGKTLTSPKGAEGYTQIMPATAKGEGFPNAGENVYDNISGGISYLRKGFDEAKKKGYDDEQAWYMAARGYLNGQHRQEANITDGNVYTDEYEATVKAGWEKRIKDLGEREDDWNDPKFFSPMESADGIGDGGESPEMTTAVGDEAVNDGAIGEETGGVSDGEWNTDLATDDPAQVLLHKPAPNEEEKKVLAQKAEQERVVRDDRVKEFFGKNFESDVAIELFESLEGLTLKEKRAYTDDDVNRLLRNRKRQRLFQPEELEILKKNAGEERFADYQKYLISTKQSPSLDSLNNWQIVYNAKNAKNPASIPVRVPNLLSGTSTTNGIGDVAVDLLDDDPNLTTFSSAVSGKNSQEVLAKTYSAVAKNGDLTSKIAKGGFEEFVKNSGLDFGRMTPENRTALNQSYLKNVQQVAAIAPDGNVDRISQAAIEGLIGIVKTQGVVGLDNPDNQWIRDFAFKNPEFYEIIRTTEPEVFDALDHDRKYGAMLVEGHQKQQQKEQLLKMIESGIVADNVGYEDGDVNYSQLLDESGGNFTIAGKKLFSRTAAKLGFSPEEIEMADSYDPSPLTQRQQGGYVPITNLNMLDNGSNNVSGNIISNYSIRPSAVQSLMLARKAIASGAPSIFEYKNGITNGISNSIRFIGKTAQDIGSETALIQLQKGKYTDNPVESAKETALGSVFRGFGVGVNDYANLVAGFIDIGEVATKGALSPTSQRDSNIRKSLLDDLHQSALTMLQPSEDEVALNKFLESPETNLSQKIIFKTGEAVSHLATQMPLYSLYGATGGGLAIPVNIAKQFHTGTISGVVKASALDIAMFGVARGISSKVATSSLADKALDYTSKVVQKYLPSAQKGTTFAEEGFAERVALSVEQSVTDSGNFANKYQKYLSISAEQIVQIAPPFVEPFMSTNLSPEGRMLKNLYDRIKKGERVFANEGLTEEIQAQREQSVLEEYKNLTAALTAENIVANLAIAVILPLTHGGHSKVDATKLTEAGDGNISLVKDTLYSAIVKDSTGRDVVEYSGFVQLPSGKTEYMVIPKEMAVVKERLTAKDVVAVEKKTVDGLLTISRLNNRLNTKAEYVDIAKTSQESALALIDKTNPVLSIDAKQRVIEETVKRLDNQDGEARKYIAEKQAEAQMADRLMDEDLQRMVIEEQKVLQQKEKDSADRKEYVEGINEKLQDKTVSETDKVGMLADKRSIIAEEYKAQNEKPSTQADFSEGMLKVAETVNKDVAVGKEYGRPDELYNAPSEKMLMDMADHLENSPDATANQRMKASYDALAKETTDQYNSLVKQGFKFEAYKEGVEPYKNSKEMLSDLRDNKHLFFFPTDAGFGKEGADYGSHPLMADSGLKDSNGNPMLHNDVFRAVHDALGHGVVGVQFGARGEHNATIAHSRNFSETALPALLSETSFQNAYVNYGKHLRKGGKVPKKGEEGFVSATERPFADQKVVDVSPDWVNRWKDETKEAGGDKQPFSRKDYEAISKQLEKAAAKVSDFKTTDQKRAIARLVADKAAFISDSGVLVSAKEAETHPEFTNLTNRKIELQSIDKAAELLATIPDEPIEAPQTVSKGEESNKTAASDEKSATASPESSGEVVGLAGQKIKYKSDNRTVDVVSETAKTVTDKAGNVISKSLLELPKANKPKASDKVNDSDVSEVISRQEKGKINLKTDEFHSDNESSIGKIASDGTLVVNDNFANIIGEVIKGKFSGLQIDQNEVELLTNLLKKEGYISEANAIDEMMKEVPKNQGLVMIRASDKDIEFTSSHEFIHKRMKEVFGEFSKKFSKQVQQIVDTVRNAIEKDTFYKDISDADLLQEIIAHGLTFDSKGLRVKPAVLTRALFDVVKSLSKEYSSKKVDEVVNLILKDIDSFNKKVELNPEKVKQSKETIKNEYEKAKQPNEISEAEKDKHNADIRQAITDSNEAESFISVKNIQDKRGEGIDEGNIGKDAIGRKKIPEDKSYDAEESDLFERRSLPTLSKSEVNDFLKTDAASMKIIGKGNEIGEGQKVGVRLNLNVLKNTGKMIQTIHDKNYSGEALAYEQAVTLENAKFNVNQKARELIASNQQNKFPMASVDGSYVKTETPNFDGLEISFNPKMNHLFVDSTGRPIKSAEEAVVMGNRVYARGKIEYYDKSDMPASISLSNVKVDAPFQKPSIGLKKVDTETESFRKFFEGSRVVDGNGKPLEVYHSTSADKDFDISDTKSNALGLGTHFGTAEQANDNITTNKNFKSGKDRIIPSFLNIQNPLRLPDVEDWAFPKIEKYLQKEVDKVKDRKIQSKVSDLMQDTEQLFYDAADGFSSEKEYVKSFHKLMKTLGYDGVVYKNKHEGNGEDSFIVFEPTQIKSSIGNDGSFSRKNPSFLRKVDTETPEFKKFIEKSEAKEPLYHATKSDFDVFSRDRIGATNLAFHIGTLKQADDFLQKEGSLAMPLYAKVENPILLQDTSGSWNPSEIIRQLRENHSDKFEFSELRELSRKINSLNEIYRVGNRAELYKKRNELMIEFLKSKGYDSVKYLNRFEGLGANSYTNYKYSIDREVMPDYEFSYEYGAEHSYIVFEPINLKSAISNDGKFSKNPSILFKKDPFDDSEVHELTIKRLTQSGDPFSFTGKNGAEHWQRLSEKVEPVFNFFVKDTDGYDFETDFGKNDVPHLHMKAFEAKSNFRLYDIYEDYQSTGRRLWVELGAAQAMKILKTEGYDGFFNSNEDVSRTFRNRISLFDTPANRIKIESGDTSAEGNINDKIFDNVELNNVSSPEKLKAIALKKFPETQLAEEINSVLPAKVRLDTIDFENDQDASIVADYMNNPDVSIRKLATKYDISYRQARNTLRKYEVPMDYSTNKGDKYTKTLTPEQLEYAKKAYTATSMAERKSLGQLGDRFNIDKETMGRILREEGIETDDAVTSNRKTGRMFYYSNKSTSAYSSDKTESPAIIDSSYELAFMGMLDSDSSVKNWKKDSLKIPYVFDGKNFTYFPDFLIEKTDGSTELVEVKPQYMLNDAKNRAKYEAAKLWAKDNNADFRVVTETEIGVDGFSKINLEKVTGDEESVNKLAQKAKIATRIAKAFKAVQDLKSPITEKQKSEHSENVQIGLKRIIEEVGDIPTSENERKATTKWLEGYKTNKSKEKFPESNRLVIQEGMLNDIVSKQKNSLDFELDGLTTASKKYVRVSKDLPKAVDTDSGLIEIALKGIGGKDWYQNSFDILTSFKGNSLGEFLPETFVRLVGATGQGVNPRDNFVLATKYLNRMLSGVYGKDNPKTAIEELKSAGIFNGDGRYKIPASNVSDAMNNVDLSTRKLGDYTAAFLGDSNKVVADEWMNRLFTGKSGAPTPVVYDYIEGRVRHIARIMNITPAQAQAVLWVGYKKQVGDFIALQIERMNEAGASKTEVVRLQKTYEKMKEGADFNDLATSLGVESRIIPEFPTSAVVANYKNDLLGIVETKALPKVEKGQKEVLPKIEKAVGYYYDLNKDTKSQGRIIVDSKKLNTFLESNSTMRKDFASIYESLYLNVEPSKIQNKDLGMAGEAIFRASYLKEQGIDISKVDFNKKQFIDKSKLKKLGLFSIGDEDIYYSKMERVISEKMDNRGNPNQIRNLLIKSGVRKEEIDWMGLDEFFEGKNIVTKAEMQEFIGLNKIELTEVMKDDKAREEALDMIEKAGNDWANKIITSKERNVILEKAKKLAVIDSTEYKDWTLEQGQGGENYKEFLLTLPTEGTPQKIKMGRRINELEANQESNTEEYRQLIKNYEKDVESEKYTSPHWKEKNVVAHFRGDERITVDGERTFHIAEIQSDWGQEGREKGYKSNKGEEGVPDMPFKKSWHELTFRRALKYAVDNGFDALTFDVGKTSAERYELTKAVEEIKFQDIQNTKYQNKRFVEIFLYNNSNRIGLRVDKETGIVEDTVGKVTGSSSLKGKSLSEIIGKEISDRVLTQPDGILREKGLEIGGEGMKTFYDKIIPNYANKFIKKYGSKIEESSVSLDTKEFRVEFQEEIDNAFRDGDKVYVQFDEGLPKIEITHKDTVDGMFGKGERIFIKKVNKEDLVSVHKVEITPSMKTEIYQKPIALFKKPKDETAQITALKTFSYPDWIDLATDISQNGIITTKEAQDIQDLVTAKDLDGLQKYVSNLNTEGLLAFASSLRRAGLLSGIKTSARNIISNVAFQTLEEVSRIPASISDIAISTVFRKERTIQGISPVGIARALHAASTSGLKQAYKAMKSGDNYFSMDDVQIQREKTTGYKVLRPLEITRNIVFRAMGAQDLVFRTFAEERAKYELAWLKAKANKTDTATEYANLDIVDLDKAAYAASVAVFQNENAINKAYQNWRGNKSEAVKFMLDLKIPFAKTASNIFERVLEYSGIGGLYKLANTDKETFKNAISDADTRRAFQFAVSKGMSGIAFMILGYALYQKNMLYGFNDESDQSLKKIQEAENSAAGSILLGGKWRDISSLSPISTLLLIGATYARQKQKETQALAEEKQTASEKAINYTKILIQVAQQSPFIRAGVDTLSERSYGSPFAVENLLPIDSFVPSIVAEIGQSMDKYKRSTAGDTTFEKIRNKTLSRLPVLREMLPTTKDALGNPKEQPIGQDPFISKTDQSTAVTKEAKRLNYEIPVPKRKDREIPSLYNQRKKESGDVVTEILSQIVKDEKYKEVDDGTKKDMLKITSAINHNLTITERSHNVQVYLNREKLEKELSSEIESSKYLIDDKEKKKIITALFSKTLVSKTRNLKDAKESFNELMKSTKSLLKEALEDWQENKEDVIENELEKDK